MTAAIALIVVMEFGGTSVISAGTLKPISLPVSIASIRMSLASACKRE